MKKENNLYDKSYKFAIRIVKAYQFLNDNKREFVLSKQLLRSGTSIGANVAEANGRYQNQIFQVKFQLPTKNALRQNTGCLC